MKRPVLLLLLAIFPLAALAADPILEPDDTVALVGGANIERTRIYPYLQTQLVAAFPEGAVRIRNFGWEGDTVFEQWRDGGDVEKLDEKRRQAEKRIQEQTASTSWRQQRDWRQQLTGAGVTVVIAQFGQMESLAGKDGLPAFFKAYESLIGDFTDGGRRLVIVSPMPFEKPDALHAKDLTAHNADVRLYADAIRQLAATMGVPFIDLSQLAPTAEPLTDNSFHLNERGHRVIADTIATAFALAPKPESETAAVYTQILELERLWFDYWRPMNWAFLTGDRSNVAYSKDWKDADKRIFPEEMNDFLPLLELAEANVRAALAGKATTPIPVRSSIPVEPPSAKPQSPGEQLASFEILDGFAVNLFASEADGVIKPIQVRWDERGRLWVACALSYPQIKPGEKANDYVLVCEDTDGDGRADKFDKFVEGLFMPAGIELGDGGLYVAQGTELLHFRDTDGDGKADKFNDFAKMDHPRGLIYDNGSLWVLHPPFLTVYRDTNGDGMSDQSEVLIEGISTEEVNKRGADHTTNGIRMGIDGWIYIAVGDFGFNKAVAKDGTTLSKRGGGVVRIRPDGTEMEVFSWGQRNIVDIAIDPQMNIFTRDNTNDGGGWDIRLSHIMQTANYGYPSQYINFTQEIMPPLADYGGGSGCGALYFQDDRWPAPYNDMLLTCDWGRSEVFSHRLPKNGATYDAQQDTFVTIPRPTDADADASGRLFVTSWKGGQFAYDGPNIGFVAMITPSNFVPHPVGDLQHLDAAELVQQLRSPSDAVRLASGRALALRYDLSQGTRRADALPLSDEIIALAKDHTASMHSRVAAIWTLRQSNWDAFKASFSSLLIDADLREHVIRAAADRKSQIDKGMMGPIFSKLDDSNPRVQAAAIVAMGRMGETRAAKELLELASASGAASAPRYNATAGSNAGSTGALTPDRSPQETNKDAWRQPDPDRVIPHLAIKALVDLNSIDECLAALNGPHRAGALAALKRMHDPKTVDGLFTGLSTSRDESLRREIWTTLIRLYHREGEFTVDSPNWWGTRPDTIGPYYDRQKWSESDRIADAIKVAMTEGNETLQQHITEQLKKHVVNLEGVSAGEIAMAEPDKAILLPKADPNDKNAIANLPPDVVAERAAATPGDVAKGQLLFKQQSCINCHTFANGQQPKGPHLVDIGKRYKRAELIESILNPSKKIAQGFDTWAFAMVDGKVYTGFVVLESAETVTVRDATGISRELHQQNIEDRVKQEISMMPIGIVGNLSPQQLADLIAYLESLR